MTEPLTAAKGKKPSSRGPLEHVIPLGRWAGVRVSAHWSVLFGWLLFAELLAVSVLPEARPGQSAAAYWLAAVATALVFFGFVLAHELAHAATARHFGVDIHSVTLWMLGGVSELTHEPPTPRADALIAAAGPATSLLLGAVTEVVSIWLGSGLVAVSIGWLGAANIVLAVFNLLPGAPLDGGRLLRALLWWHYHDRPRAVVAATRAGRGLGITLSILGILEVLAGSWAGLWLVFIGWFVTGAAAAEQARLRREIMRGVPARAVMVPIVLVAPEWWTAEQFFSRLSADAAAQPVFPLVDFDGRITGALTLPDLAALPADQRGERRLREVAAGRRFRPLVLAPDSDLAEIAPLLALHGEAVVAEDGRPIGLITRSEVGGAAQHFPQDAGDVRL